MVEKSMLDIAYELIVAKGEPVSFKDIWSQVLVHLPATPSDRVARFYTNMTLDGRFVALGGNMWDLRSKYTFKELYEDARGVFRDVEEIEEEKEIDPFEEPEEELLDDEEVEIEDDEEIEKEVE
ncbi:MAG TPA: DNA-directed RNA polymerase subunit delta [Bacilli bacterium]|jgi:DNA-directed RNA polymerase subunit delta|nr:DNA-directed RNA polymerase subunit delta [Bacilli bacterium]